ncbi:MAG: fused MFS/spermidine synthase [Myxococcota bacterium]|nr:fused MFS/spermidine synthase [Myxococcota bacterium]
MTRVAPLLFGSGMCALIYQTVWLRELRLIFGASTAASAAVLAIFMGGLGAGGIVIGRRADRMQRPLDLYAGLELLISVSAMLTPALIWFARKVYVALGGSLVLGTVGGTLLRLVLSTLVLLVPTFLMGGTLPAAVRAVESEEDARRRNLAVLYGVNTLGAVVGALLSTFLLLEVLGQRTTLLCAGLLNIVVGMTARAVSRSLPAVEWDTNEPAPTSGEPSARAPLWFVLSAAAAVGFAFLLMELVWYRMLSPILGGSSFTFGLILAVALLGIGLGGVAYALWGQHRRATLGGFALSCTLEALCLALPFALGDRLAVLAALLRPLGHMGFAGHVLGWTLVTAVVVLPAAFVSGVQFPLLIALLGEGRREVGRQVGLGYAWNTAGAIGGSLAGGFGLMPLLSAPGTWRMSAWLLIGLGVAAAALSMRGAAGRVMRPSASASTGILTALLAALLLQASGPTAAWRHSGIGVGRGERLLQKGLGRNGVRDWLNERRRAISWEVDGVESSVAIGRENGLSFIVNGKVDGNARGDAGTQVMSGLIGAALLPRAERVLVIGLGTGSTAGWLAALPWVDRVDAVEIEPAIVRFALDCGPVNHGAMRNPKLRTLIGDGREVLLTSPERYHLIVSEPSNPYRAGIASLFTQDFYRSARARLQPGGLFLQWMQAYSVDSQTVRTTYATLASVFPVVETWQTQLGDLLLVGAAEPIRYDADLLRTRLQQPPLREALLHVWRTETLEGFLARFVAGARLARDIARQEGDVVNTDDHNLLEFAFARGIGEADLFNMGALLQLSRRRGDDRPPVQGAVDWSLVDQERVTMLAMARRRPYFEQALSPEQRQRARAQLAYAEGNLVEALHAWPAAEPRNPFERLLRAETLAAAGDEAALPYIEALRADHPTEADVVLATLRHRQGRHAEAVAALERALIRHRTDPWPLSDLMQRALRLAVDLAVQERSAAARLRAALREPFVLRILDEERIRALVDVTMVEGPADLPCVEAFSQLEPHVPWGRGLLAARKQCYEATGHPLAPKAAADLAEFQEAEPPAFQQGL